MMPRRACLPLAALALVAATAPAAEPAADGLEFFEKRIRPLLVENCHGCHSTGKKQKAHLSLDNRAGLMKGGDTGPAVVPGKPEASLLIKAVRYQDAELRMPPRRKLPDAAIADLTAWVKMGAPWPKEAGPGGGGTKGAFDLRERRKHWCWQPLRVTPPPAVRRPEWVRNPVDAFLLAKLEAAGIQPAPPADKRTLLRRVTFDLTGLPPTPQEIDDFLKDDSPDAYEKVVDRLLASPAYGERWGRHWLDLVRYAETCGHEFDFDLPEAHEYRDYVIRAFNDDVPYDQLVTEHVAGDLLPRPRRRADGANESVLGTGFWFLGEMKHSPVDVRQDEAERMDNQIDVFSKAFLGLTVSCARCHDHKFDAITQKDYYALVGYLESSRLQRAFLDPPEQLRPVLARLRRLHAEGEALAAAATARTLQARLGRLADHLLRGGPDWERAAENAGPGQLLYPWKLLGGCRTAEEFTAKRRELVGRMKAQARQAEAATARATAFADFAKEGYRDWAVTGEAFGDRPGGVSVATLQGDRRSPVKAVRPAGLAHSGTLSNRLLGNLRSRTFTIEKKRILYHVAGTGGQVNLVLDNYQLIRDPIYGGLTFTVRSGDRFEWRVMDVSRWVGHRAYVEVLDEGPGNVAVDRILFSDDGPPPEPPNRALLQLLDDPALTTREALARKYQQLLLDVAGQWRDGKLASAPDSRDRVALLNAALQDVRLAAIAVPAAEKEQEDYDRLLALMGQFQQIEATIPPPRRALAMADGTGWDERVFIRGNHKSLGEPAPRRFLEAVAGADQPAPAKGSGRLELARRLTDPSNPLLPRVMVNRLWKHHFGEGIVRSVDNFGALGEAPTHPELLDWLAREFMGEPGASAPGGTASAPGGRWSLKHLHRLMVTSSAYRMASRGDPSPLPLSPKQGRGVGVRAEEADPQNRLLHRMPVRRLEAEAVRDTMLAVSGRLDRRMGGPGVMPYLTPFMLGRGRPGHSGPLDGDGRRSVYLAVRRNFLNPMFLAFDYPIPFTTMGRRGVSNVPAQALTLMNNPFVLQQAQTWARRVLAEEGRTPRERVTALYLTAFARPPAESELAAALAFLEEQGKQYGKADDPRAWADLCHVLMNVKEFIFVN
ncbi:MAG TPA: PSD1 and planctomycete cytochrome C domain-containing protein [Gemmataceae bacterium]|nr:PSD1 and planctomycete cytochrome C domain-containing protein [Gemmataceae bacterium]